MPPKLLTHRNLQLTEQLLDFVPVGDVDRNIRGYHADLRDVTLTACEVYGLRLL